MDKAANTVQVVLLQLANVLEPLERELAPGKARSTIAELGIVITPAQESAIATSLQAISGSASALLQMAEELTAAIDAEDTGDIIAKSVSLINQIANTIQSIEGLQTAVGGLGGIPPAAVDKIPERLFNLLLVRALESARGVNELLELFGILERQHFNQESTDPDNPPHTVSTLNFSLIGKWLKSPSDALESLYKWGDPAFDGVQLLNRLENFLLKLGAPAFFDATAIPPSLEVVILEVKPRTDLNPKGLSLNLRQSFIPGTITTITNDLKMEFEFGFKLPFGTDLIIQPDAKFTFVLPDASETLSGALEFRLSADRTQAAMPYLIIGEPGGSRLEVRKFATAIGGQFSSSGETSEGEVSIVGAVQGGKLIVSLASADSFLREIISNGNFETDFAFGFGYSSDEGLYFIGSSTLEIQLPLHLDLGPVNIRALTISIGIENQKFPAAITVNFKAALGPLTATIEGVGFKADFALKDNRDGNAGPLDIQLGFKPPSGIGLTIDGGGFKGGGLLDFEEDEQRYVGFLELEFKEKVAIKALGLLTTRLPDGSEGFSLLIIITAEFTPIQLGFGFTLNGIGGLLGLNRTAKVERLRTGVNDNTLSSILFPQNIVANANRIISDLRQVFPPQADRFIFGPMAKIGWGSPTLITIDLGLMIEVPNPVRLLILGVLRAQIPNEEERKKKEGEEGREIPRILQLQINFLGEINFEEEWLTFDAILYDSQLLSFTLSGNMAVRLSWGSEPNFLLTVGGFHPAYNPPAVPVALPNLQRLTLSLLSGNNPRLTLETYFAVTSNTVQFGAKLELYAVKYKFNVYGFLSFDVLFQFSPFLFIADIGAMLALRIGSSNIASINVSLTLSGPTPWHARGTAKLKICWFFTLKVRFNKTFGEERDTRLDDVPVLPLLQAALSNTGNWEVQIPRGRHALVSVREIAVSGNEVVADPAGVIRISQKVVPLNVTIEKFGHQQPSDGHHFAIDHVRVGPVNETDLEVMELLSIAAVHEHFAPAQFFEKSDTEKLSSRSFEYYDSGVKLSESEELATDYAARRPVEYEVFYPHEQRHGGLRRRTDRLPPDFAGFNAGTSQGAIAGSPLSSANKAKSALAPSAVRFSQEQFVVVNAIDLLPVTEEAVAASEAGAYSLMNEMIRNNPDREGELQVVPTFEVTRS